MKNFYSLSKGSAVALTVLSAFAACERVDYNETGREPVMSSIISLPSVAQMISSLPL